MSFSPCVLMWKPYRCSKRTARMMRVGSSTKLRAWMMRIVLRWMSLWAAEEVDEAAELPLLRRRAIALMVKSRRNRSILMEESSTVGRAAGYL